MLWTSQKRDGVAVQSYLDALCVYGSRTKSWAFRGSGRSWNSVPSLGDARGTPWMCWVAGGGVSGWGQAVPLCPCALPSFVQSPCHVWRFWESCPRALPPPCISDPPQVPPSTWTGRAVQVSGEFSAETLRVRTPGVAPRGSFRSRCLLCLPPSCCTPSAQDWNHPLLNLIHGLLLLRAITLEPLRFSWGEMGCHLNIQNLWPFRGKI